MSFLLNSASIITCPHGGRILCKPFYGINYLVDGSPVCVKEDAYSIYGCPSAGHQCHSVKWIDDSPAFLPQGRNQILTQSSIGICLDRKNSPTGKAVVVSVQTRVSAEDWQQNFKTKGN